MWKRVLPLASGLFLLMASLLPAQDVMQYDLKHWSVLAENDEVRVLRFAPKTGDKTPIHTHPPTVVYIVKGGKVKITMADGSAELREYPTGEAYIRPEETHADEAVEEVEILLIELKK